MTRGLDQSTATLEDVPTTINPADAAQLLARLPLVDLPRLVWTITEMGSLTGCPPPHTPADEQHAVFDAWAEHLGLEAERQRFHRGMCHLKARGVVQGVDVMIWSAHNPKWRALYDQ